MSNNMPADNVQISAGESGKITSKTTTKNLVDDGSIAKKTRDPQVKPKRQCAPRRTYSPEYKRKILSAYNACQNAEERGALLRREGLHHSRICAWRDQQAAGKLNSKKCSKKAARLDNVARENEQLKKKLAQAEAIIDLQKKVSELFGTHILPHDQNDKI